MVLVSDSSDERLKGHDLSLHPVLDVDERVLLNTSHGSQVVF